MIQNTEVLESRAKLKPMYANISVCLMYAKGNISQVSLVCKTYFKANVTKLHKHHLPRILDPGLGNPPHTHTEYVLYKIHMSYVLYIMHYTLYNMYIV